MLSRIKGWLVAIGGLLLAVVTLGGWLSYERKRRLSAEAVAHLRKELSDVEKDIRKKQKKLDEETKIRLRALRSRRKALERALLKRKDAVRNDRSNVVDWVNTFGPAGGVDDE